MSYLKIGDFKVNMCAFVMLLACKKKRRRNKKGRGIFEASIGRLSISGLVFHRIKYRSCFVSGFVSGLGCEMTCSLTMRISQSSRIKPCENIVHANHCHKGTQAWRIFKWLWQRESKRLRSTTCVSYPKHLDAFKNVGLQNLYSSLWS